MSEARVLVVEDDAKMRKVCVRLLQRKGCEVVAVEGAKEALAQARMQTFDLVLTDIRMPGMPGDVLIDRLKRIQPEILPVIMTGFPTMELAIEAFGRGVCEFLTKPFRAEKLLTAVRTTLIRRQEEMLRGRRQLAAQLLEMEQNLGEDFDLRASIEALIEKGERESAATGEAARSAEGAARHQERTLNLAVMFCEPIPHSSNLLRTSERYQHFRVVFMALRLLNEHFKRAGTPASVELLMVPRTADISRHFRPQRGQRICSVIFGPNFPILTEATVRLMVGEVRGANVVVCHNPEKASWSPGLLDEFRSTMGVTIVDTLAPESDIKSFWVDFFVRKLKPLVEERATTDGGRAAVPARDVSTEEVRAIISEDGQSMLPGFSPVCRQAIRTIDQGKGYARISEIIRPDGGLQEALIHTANLGQYGALERIKTVPMALSMIGIDEAKRVILARAMDRVVGQIDEVGFDNADFLAHSACTGFLAQLLSLDVENPSSKERKILEGLKLPQYVSDILQEFRCWEAFPSLEDFDVFSAGFLHDIGKVVNVVSFQGVVPFVLHEIERSGWGRNGLIECEAAVVGKFQHPTTAGVLLERWEIFPHLMEPIRVHHRTDFDGFPAAALIALANGLAKGLYPFPREIDLPREFRKRHLDAAAREDALVNPLPSHYRRLVAAFERDRSSLSISQQERETGSYEPENVQGLIRAARQVNDQMTSSYVDGLTRQNPEFENVADWMEKPAEDLIALSLLLRDYLEEKMRQFRQVTTAARPN